MAGHSGEGILVSGIVGHVGLLLPAPSGGGGPGSYNPAGWYDADDLSTLFQDAAGTIPVAADGDPVGRWNDKSGNGRNWTQTTSGSRPIYHESGGKSWVEFDGSNYWMVGSTGMLAFADIATFVGMRCISGGGDFGTVIAHGQNTSHVAPYYRWSIQTRNSGSLTIDFHTNGTRFDNAVPDAAAGNDVLVAVGYASMWSSASSAQRHNMLRINGSINESGNAGSQTVTYPNSNPSSLGAQVDGGGDRFKGRIYSILVSDSPVTSQAWIDAWEAWIIGKMP